MIDDLSFLENNQKRIEKALNKALPNKSYSNITEAIHYSVMDGGKRIRPQLVYLVADSLDLDLKDETIDAMAAAGELIHCYSLIHDDLPAMDDDDLRRGKPSCHIKFGEASAILAGDAIQPLALEIITDIEDPKLSADTKIKIISTFSKACGPFGMVEGQNRDIKSENSDISIDELDMIHALKTGKLISACVHATCLLKEDLPESDMSTFIKFSECIGLAFQIKDDILDCTSSTEDLGKPAHSDEYLKKNTYPKLIGVEESLARADSLCEEAIKCLKSLPYKTEKLIKLSKFIVERNN